MTYKDSFVIAGFILSGAFLLAVLSAPLFLYADNLYSIDLESSSSQYLAVDDASQSGLDLSGSDFTVSAWVKFESLPTAGNDYAVVGKRNGTGNQRSYYLAVRNDSGNYKMVIQTSPNGSAFYDDVSTTISISTDTWYHLAWTYQTGTGAGSFYLDGSPVSTFTAETAIYDSTSQWRIGAIGDGVYFFDGLINSVQVFDTKLSDAAVAALYSDVCAYSRTDMISMYLQANNADDIVGLNDLSAYASPTYSSDVPDPCVDPGGGDPVASSSIPTQLMNPRTAESAIFALMLAAGIYSILFILRLVVGG